MTRRTIAIVFGGRSEEHAVSLKSAREVAKSLDTEKFDPIWIGISTTGSWLLCKGPDSDLERDGLPRVVLSPDPTVHGVLVLEEASYRTIRLDLVLPVLHGRFGEDGSIQGMLETSGIPYIGCDVSGSVLAMDKSLAYLAAQAGGIATPRFWIVQAGETFDPAAVDFPVFVKPARSGSSFGVAKVERVDELADAISIAREYDSKVLIEQAVVGREIGCAILGNDADLTVGELDRVALTHGFFRIHQEASPESGSENSHFIVPADIPAESKHRVAETAIAIYRALGCRGLARVDLFLLDDGSVVLNEVNTMPGLTSYSRFPRMMAAAGVSLTELIDRLSALALAGPSR